MRNLLLAFAAASTLASLPAVAATATFSDQSFNLVGTASMQGSDLQLTTATPYDAKVGFLAGAAWLTTRYSSSQSFSATYGFSLATNTNYMADGIAFVLQGKSTSALGYAGSSLGYSGNGLNGVGSLIQTWKNNSIGLNTDGTSTASSAKDAPSGLVLTSADRVTGTETVSYNADTHLLSMAGTLFVTDTAGTGKNATVSTSQYSVSDSTFIDLSQKFTQGFYLGFTGATGSVVSDQRITSFSVTAVPEPETYAMLLAGLSLMGAVARRRNAGQA